MSGIVSSIFLASSIMYGDSSGRLSMTNDTYGMDHRAIVWCHDVLTVVRELIFELVNATDTGLSSHERLLVTDKVMHKRRRKRSSDAAIV